ncbi:MAG TPA: hypothetical protein VMW52_00625 [Phycisphaerae bacterium]|nr:hypothetical protein [Phycisphaerae bacterium]
MILHIKITYDGAEATVGQRRLREINRTALGTGMRFMHQELLPGHFEPGASERYDYAPRSEHYKRRKPRYAREIALVRSGRGKREILAMPHIQAFPTRATMTLSAPSYFRMMPAPGQPDMAAEVFTVLPEEKTRIEIVMGKTVVAELRKRGIQKTVVVG